MAGDALSFTYGETLKTLFEETNNPIFVWREISFRMGASEPLPQWVTDYLLACAARLNAAESGEEDVKTVLPGVFGFELRRGPGNPLSAVARASHDRLYALEFSAAILRGEKPSEARDSAYNRCSRTANGDEKTLRERLKKFFSVDQFHSTNTDWKRTIILWLLKHPEYIPELPSSEPFLNIVLQNRSLFPATKRLEVKSVPGMGRIARDPDDPPGDNSGK
jgi:hypothetical protein